MNSVVLQISGLRKAFNGVEVLHSVDLSVERAKVTALVGENGAGKSTLMKILMGEYLADSGEITLDGEKVRFTNSHQALSHGVSMIFQEMSPFPDLTVAQNIYVGREPRRLCFVKNRELRKNAQLLLDGLGINIDPDRMVKTLTVSELQLLEIVKAVSYDSKIVIMDEPTSALTDSEVKLLFDMIAKLKAKGVSIIYISHKLDELFCIADSVCVLRDGSIISARPIEQVDRSVMIAEMVGRTIEQVYPSVEKTIGETILTVEGLERRGEFHDVSFELHRGEILGFAGMVGAGRTEIVSALFGISRYSKGNVYLHGEKLTIRSPRDAISNHFALVPEDRGKCGLNLRGSIGANSSVTVLDKIGRSGGFWANPKQENLLTDDITKKMRVKMNGRNQLTGSLSGGNQQKIVVGKWLLTEPEIIFMDEPTRGIDVGAKYEIYQLIQNLAKQGKAVLVISSEMPELLGICDRILVIKDGRIVGETDTADATQEKIMAMIVNG